MKKLDALEANDKNIELVELPDCRIIGKEIRTGGPLKNQAPKLWDEIFENNDAKKLLKLPNLLFNNLCGWTMEYEAETNTFIYMVCVITKSDTNVPFAYSYRDIKSGLCAVGLLKETVNKTLSRISKNYTNDWLNRGWNAEIYFNEEEHSHDKKPAIHWLVPITEKVKI